MKPCRKNRKVITWMVLGELEGAQRDLLVAHLEECSECREYFEEMSGIAWGITHSQTKEGVQVSPLFHQRLVSKLSSQEKRAVVAAFVERLRWVTRQGSVALSAIGIVALALIGILIFPRSGDIPTKGLETRLVTPGPPARNSIEPTLSNYEMVANLAPERFDKLLTEQGSRNPSPAPIYRASALSLEIGPD